MFPYCTVTTLLQRDVVQNALYFSRQPVIAFIVAYHGDMLHYRCDIIHFCNYTYSLDLLKVGWSIWVDLIIILPLPNISILFWVYEIGRAHV